LIDKKEKEKIVFTNIPEQPGVKLVCRKQSERDNNPGCLNLDNKELTNIPRLQDEEGLRSLSLQSNSIGRIDNLVSLPSLTYLDLTNNKIKEINNLQQASTLRVLILSKNNIEKIKNLQYLVRLDVLDLHSNKISKIENLGNLSELRVLNLADNRITVVNNLSGLISLKELNLRKNLIEKVNGLASCPKLQLLFLSENNIRKIENISSITEAKQLNKLTLDFNPLCVSHSLLYNFCIKACPHLKHIGTDIKRESELKNGDIAESSEKTDTTIKPSDSKPEEPSVSNEKNTDCKTIADKVEFKEKIKSQGEQHLEKKGIPHDEFIKVIEQEWKAEITRLKTKPTNIGMKKEAKNISLLKGGHAELEEGIILSIYGNALEVLDNIEFQKNVTQITFQYVHFNNIINHSNLSKLMKFQKLNKLCFSHNCLSTFSEISMLESLPYITELTIEHNTIAKTNYLKLYILSRFKNLSVLNSEPVSEIDRYLSHKLFSQYNSILHTSPLFKVYSQYNT